MTSPGIPWQYANVLKSCAFPETLFKKLRKVDHRTTRAIVRFGLRQSSADSIVLNDVLVNDTQLAISVMSLNN